MKGISPVVIFSSWPGRPGALAASQFIPPRWLPLPSRQPLDLNGDGYIPTMCEMCVWRCGVLAKVKDGRVVKLEGNPIIRTPRASCAPRGQAGIDDHLRSGPRADAR